MSALVHSNDKILLIVAHPDDEVMFFGPLLASTQRLSILCLSTGNYEGLGKTRMEELNKCAEVFNIPSRNVSIIDHQMLQDGMETHWPLDVIEGVVFDHIKSNEYNKIFIFDEYGISGHPNHIAASLGSQKAIKKLRTSCPFSQLKAYKLSSRNVVRKFLGIFEVIIVLFLFRERYCLLCWQPWKIVQGMKCHRSQFVWFRQIFIFISIYTYINSYKEVI
mmetsp:Transcript_5727/g.6248  ORF Transcript_5727/g.6248 Transcript_5727/m.6248 type:complete len:220 (+) Transcript_5727:6-665(+)